MEPIVRIHNYKYKDFLDLHVHDGLQIISELVGYLKWGLGIDSTPKSKIYHGSSTSITGVIPPPFDKQTK